MQKHYKKYPKKIISANQQFKHILALTLSSKKEYKEGVIRCIVSRSGYLKVSGNIDRSQLNKINGANIYNFKIGDKLKIKGEEKIIKKINKNKLDFLGLEDPDIWIDEKNNLLHLYFTIPLIDATSHKNKIHLGHAVGKNLDSLTMTMPVLLADKIGGAKELSVAPKNKKGVRLNLVESSDKIGHTEYSVVRVAITKDMSKNWKFGKIVFHPKDTKHKWIAGHASPGPLFSKDFIDVGNSKLLGIINGCEANKIVKGKTIYGTFSVGLFIYDYEKGKIDWVSPRPLIEDSNNKSRKITFASQFVETKKGQGVLYAHMDDSYIKAYELRAEDLKPLLPK